MLPISDYRGSELLDDSVDIEFSIIDLTLEQLLESNFHLGSKLSKFEKLNFSFIFSKRFDVLILNLTYSLYNLKLASYFLTTLVSRRGKVLFFDSHDATRIFVHFIGLTARQYYINQKWIAGLLTNFKNFYPAVFTGVSRHFNLGDRYLGMRYIHRPPNVTCLLNIDRCSSAFIENFRLGIPTIALINSNDNVAGVTFPIFANNSSIYTFYTFFSLLRSAVLNGYRDEIYKFYRKSLKRILKFRYRRFVKNNFTKNSIHLYTRYYFVKFLFRYKIFFYHFFLFLFEKLKDPLFSRVISLFIRDMTYFYDRFIVHSKNYSIHNIYGKNFSFSSFDLNRKLSLLDFDIFFRLFIEILLSTDFRRYVTLFYNSLWPIVSSLFEVFFNQFSEKSVDYITSKQFADFRLDYRFFLFLLNKWGSVNSSNSLLMYKGLTHEIFPFLFPQTTESFYSFYNNLSWRFLRSPVKILLFDFSRSKFFGLYTIRKIHRYFSKIVAPFKFFKFPKRFRKAFKNMSKRLKFLTFIFKSMYFRKKRTLLFFDLKSNKHVMLSKKYVMRNRNTFSFKQRFFTGLTIKDLHRRNHLKKLFDSSMLKYFDDEFEDTPFPFNNEFFYLQVAYGRANLTREAERNKILDEQRKSTVTVVRYRKALRRFATRSRFSRLLLYFPFFVKNIKMN
jgi:small subunit ribosomal protein S2